MPSERDYAERLREQAYKTFSPQIKDLEEELKELSNSLSNGIYQIERKIEALSHIELPTTEIVLDEILEDVQRQKNQENASIVSFAHEIKEKETQEEILGLLLDYVNRFFSRVALFTVRNQRFTGWSSRGYSEESARNIAECSFPHSDCVAFQQALESKEITTAPDISDHSFLGFLQVEATQARHLISLYVMHRPVALLYVEKADGTQSNTNALSILIDLTVLRLENIALKILYALTEDKVSVPSKPVREEPPVQEEEPAQEENVKPVSDSMPAESEAFEIVEPVETEAREAEAFEKVEEPEEADWNIPIEEAPEPEAETGEETVIQIEKSGELVIESEDTSPDSPPSIPEIDAEAPEEPEETAIPDEEPEAAAHDAADWNIPTEEAPESEEETGVEGAEPAPAEDLEQLHSDAKRFARLLVSEIKLYNESQVVEGRQNRDLYLRLKRDIDKSREMYESRVSPLVAQKIDYFHDEIVRILGDNEPSTLGSDYPGSSV